MKIFRQKFTKSDSFYTLIVVYGLLAIFVVPAIFVLYNPQNNTIVSMSCGALIILLTIFLSIRAVVGCRYITISDTSLSFINPYLHTYREILLSDITRVKIEVGRCVFLHIWNKQGKRNITEIALVPRKDLKEIGKIFKANNINIVN